MIFWCAEMLPLSFSANLERSLRAPNCSPPCEPIDCFMLHLEESSRCNMKQSIGSQGGEQFGARNDLSKLAEKLSGSISAHQKIIDQFALPKFTSPAADLAK